MPGRRPNTAWAQCCSTTSVAGGRTLPGRSAVAPPAWPEAEGGLEHERLYYYDYCDYNYGNHYYYHCGGYCDYYDSCDYCYYYNYYSYYYYYYYSSRLQLQAPGEHIIILLRLPLLLRLRRLVRLLLPVPI